MKYNFYNEMRKLCDLQIDMWSDIKSNLDEMRDNTDGEVISMFHRYLNEKHSEAVLQLVKVKLAIDEIEESENMES